MHAAHLVRVAPLAEHGRERAHVALHVRVGHSVQALKERDNARHLAADLGWVHAREGARELGAYAQARRALPVPRALGHCRGLDARRRGLVHRVAQLLLARKGSGRKRQLRVLVVAPESKAVVGAQRAQHVRRRAAARAP